MSVTPTEFRGNENGAAIGRGSEERSRSETGLLFVVEFLNANWPFYEWSQRRPRHRLVRTWLRFISDSIVQSEDVSATHRN
jgi:hypothetical protein